MDDDEEDAEIVDAGAEDDNLDGLKVGVKRQRE